MRHIGEIHSVIKAMRSCRTGSQSGQAGRQTCRKECAGLYTAHCRSVAQPGRAPRSGRGGRRFKSYHSDHLSGDSIPNCTQGADPPHHRASYCSLLKLLSFVPGHVSYSRFHLAWRNIRR
jgi:hypothetical protein